MRVSTFIAVSGMFMLSACSDPNKASGDNFQHAIDAALAARPMCVDVPAESLKPAGDVDQSTFPIYVELPKPSAPQDLFKARTKQLDALVSAGLLAAKTGTIDAATMFTGSHDKLAVKIYELTDNGRKALDKAGDRPRSFLASSRDRFCYGTPEVAVIKLFTEPADAFGMKASHVRYTWRLKDVADWAKLPAIAEAFPQVKAAMNEANEAATDVVLTNNGWVDSRTMRK